MEKNEQVLDILYAQRSRVGQRDVLVSQQDLIETGWTGSLPTVMFKIFETYRVRFERILGKYKIVKVEPWMLTQKSETPADMNAPLPISGKPKFNLKELYKDQIKDGGNPKELKND